MSTSNLQNLKGLLKGMMFKHAPFMINCREFEDFISMYFEGSLPRAPRIAGHSPGE